jgi:hypothetical protein
LNRLETNSANSKFSKISTANQSTMSSNTKENNKLRKPSFSMGKKSQLLQPKVVSISPSVVSNAPQIQSSSSSRIQMNSKLQPLGSLNQIQSLQVTQISSIPDSIKTTK